MCRAIAQVKIDETLAWNTKLLRYSFEITNRIFVKTNGDHTFGSDNDHSPRLSCNSTPTPHAFAKRSILCGGHMKNTLVKASAIAHEGAITLTEDQWVGESPVWGFKMW
jgi:hypothetical protein